MVLFHVRGVPVKIGWSWLIIFLLVLWSLAAALFPSRYPGLGGATYVVMAVVATLLFFASLLVHELSHTLRSLREGVHVRGITLFLFGGVSEADEPIPSPAAEFRIVAAGPFASAVLAVLFFLLAEMARGVGLSDPWVGVLVYLAQINGLLLAFNLVPALPLDGGRLLHALLWWRTEDNALATIYAGTAGRAFGAVLIAIGLTSMLAGASVGGLWFVLIGWFLLQAVRQEVLAARTQEAFTGLRVRDLMTADLITVHPSMTLEEFSAFLYRKPSHPVYPVVEDGTFVGLLEVKKAGKVPLEDRATVRVAEVMTGQAAVAVLHPDDLVADAARVLGKEPGRAIVRDPYGGQPVLGLLSTSDLSRAVEVAPARPARRKGGRTAGVLGALAALVVVLAAAAYYRPPFVVIAPGASFDVTGDVRISGVPVQDPSGRYLLTSVELSQPSALMLLVDVLRSDRQVVSMSSVVPSGITPGELDRFEHSVFTDSQQTAAVAAARAAGYKAGLTGSGALVLGTVPSSPAAGVLQEGDVITAVDREPIATGTDLHDALSGRPAGTTMSLTVQRGGRTLHVRVTSEALSQLSGQTGIGVLAGTENLRAVLPFTVSFRARPNIGGPSAGLVYALAVSDMIDRSDDAAGRSVAATGTIAADGSVGAVGGVHEKAIAAQDAGATLMLVPVSEVGSIQDQQLRSFGVRSLRQALTLLVHG